MSRCTDCGVPVLEAVPTGPAMLGVRVVGKDGPRRKHVVELCPRCLWKRGEDAQQTRAAMATRAERGAA